MGGPGGVGPRWRSEEAGPGGDRVGGDRAGGAIGRRLRAAERGFRTGTVLRALHWLPTTAAFTIAALAGSPARAAHPSLAPQAVADAVPGAIGVQRRTQPGPRPESMLPDHVQPVEISGPEGMLVSVQTAAGWTPLEPAPLRMGLVVGAPYRMRIGGIAGREGEELFPALRVLAKVASPPGMAWRFPVEIALDGDDLATALRGHLVRRVVYASCEPERPDLLPGSWFDVRPGDDALDVARTLGDPVAEVVIGNRVPTALERP